MAKSTKTIAEHVTDIQRAMKAAEDGLAAIYKIDIAADNLEAGTVAKKLYHDLESLHCDMSLALLKYYPSFGADAVAFGPGR